MARYPTVTYTVSPRHYFARLQQGFARLGIGLGLLVLSGQVAALTMGDLVVHSRPGKPLRASIPVTLQGENLTELKVTFAPAEFYEQQQLERPTFLDSVRIGLLSTGKSSAKIQLFGEQAWKGEEAILMLQAVWPQGELSGRFRLRGVNPDNEAEEQTPRFVEVAENETLDAIAMRLSAGTNRSYLHMMYALFLANPEAFYRDNMNNLKRGVRLRVPTGAELYALKDAEVFRIVRQQYEQWLDQQNEGTGNSLVMGGKQTSTQGEAPHELQQQLQQLGEDNDSLQRRNAELKARLARLEQQIGQVTEQVLNYRPPTQAALGESESAAHPPPAEKKASPEPAAEKKMDGVVAAKGLPGYVMFIVLFLALGGGVLVWRYTAGRQVNGADG